MAYAITACPEGFQSTYSVADYLKMDPKKVHDETFIVIFIVMGHQQK